LASYSSATEQFETGDILDPSSITGNWEACSGTDCWAGTSGGPDPSWNGYTARWSYGMRTLTWTTAINQALQESGLQIDGYQYEWVVKNYNANYGSSQPGTTPDHLIITLNIYNTDNEVVHTKRFDYSYSISNWTSFTGVEYLDQSLATANLSDLEISAYGDDHGNWSGHYGPEFDVSASSVNLIYSYAPKDPCDSIPVTDPACPNYEVPGASIEELIPNIEMSLGDMTGDVITDPVAELTQPIQEVADDPVAEEPVGGLADNSTQSSQGTDQEKSGGGGLSDAQKNALAAAAAEANAAEQVAASSSATSIAIGDAANESAVGATLQNSVAMNSANQSMSSNSSGQSGSSGSNQGNNSGESSGYSPDMTNSAAGGVGQIGGAELELSITVADDIVTTELSDVVESVLRETFKKIQQQSKESATAGIDQKPSDDPAQDQKLAMMQNPDIAQYQQSFVPDAAGYDDKEIYQGQRVIDNPAGRLFNGASDQLHKQMVREQYDR